MSKIMTKKKVVIVVILLFGVMVLLGLGSSANNQYLSKTQIKPQLKTEAPSQGSQEVKPEQESKKLAGELVQKEAQKSAPSHTEDKDFLKVTRVIDGDTIEVADLGKVRLIGVDTPEVVDPRKPVQCFGRESSRITSEMLLGKEVYLEADPTQGDRDKYNRLLRYVFLKDGTNFNKWLIENGYAHEYTFLLPYKYQLEFKEAERRARENGKGLWSPDACKNGQNSQTSNQCLIKGNINSKGEKIYHLPGGEYYDKTVIDESKGERWFCSEEEAKAAGWRKSKK